MSQKHSCVRTPSGGNFRTPAWRWTICQWRHKRCRKMKWKPTHGRLLFWQRRTHKSTASQTQCSPICWLHHAIAMAVPWTPMVFPPYQYCWGWSRINIHRFWDLSRYMHELYCAAPVIFHVVLRVRFWRQRHCTRLVPPQHAVTTTDTECGQNVSAMLDAPKRYGKCKMSSSIQLMRASSLHIHARTEPPCTSQSYADCETCSTAPLNYAIFHSSNNIITSSTHVDQVLTTLSIALYRLLLSPL